MTGLEWASRYEEFLGSPEWQRIRTEVMARCGGFCGMCGSAHSLECHHWSYDRIWSSEDCEILCSVCHGLVHERIRHKVARLLAELRHKREVA